MHNAEYYQEIHIPPAEFETELSMPTSDFQKMMKEMKLAESDRLEIISNPETRELIFRCDGENITYDVALHDEENSLEYEKYGAKGIHEAYSHENILLCLGFTDMCNLLNMYIKPDYPLVIRYFVANLGDIKLAFSPMADKDKHSDTSDSVSE